MTDAFMAPVADPPVPALRDEIRDVLRQNVSDGLADEQANKIMAILNERGHYLPGAPCAQVILNDAKSFAERLTIVTLALRLLNMLTGLTLDTPETRPAKKWIEDYLEGRNHGPAGKPMIWPLQLPGICALLREWGFEPTPTMPPFVARSLPNPGMQ